MYIPSHFAETRPEELHRIIREHPLGVLITQGRAGPEADHIPFEFDAGTGAHGTLLAHIARANTLWQRCPTGTPVMVVFRGAHAYVSPNWYLSQHEAHRQVPTWNYEVVHASGTIVVHDDDRFVRRLLARQVDRYEAAESVPWKMDDSESAYVESLLGNVVGIEIAVSSLVGKAKLSQNKEPRDRLAVATTLDARGCHELAGSMRRVR